MKQPQSILLTSDFFYWVEKSERYMKSCMAIYGNALYQVIGSKTLHWHDAEYIWRYEDLSLT
jgi:hypothetical protein